MKKKKKIENLVEDTDILSHCYFQEQTKQPKGSIKQSSKPPIHHYKLIERERERLKGKFFFFGFLELCFCFSTFSKRLAKFKGLENSVASLLWVFVVFKFQGMILSTVNFGKKL